MEQDPGAIGMRDIARACGVTATTIYYYYRDKETLFEEIKLECLDEMESAIIGNLDKTKGALTLIKEGLRAFRDWAFANPRKALLVLGRFKPNLAASPEEMKRYYRSNDFVTEMLERAQREGELPAGDAKLRGALIVAGICGAVESVIVKRTYPDYWNEGIAFTDRMIEILCPEGIREREIV